MQIKFSTSRQRRAFAWCVASVALVALAGATAWMAFDAHANADATQIPAAADGVDVAKELKTAGIDACASKLNTLAAGEKGGVTTFNTVSTWAPNWPGRRPVSVFIGQKYPDPRVPYGATGVFAAPTSRGSCDALSVHIVPSPVSCDALRQAISTHGKQIGDLAGVSLMGDDAGETMLVPTGADACVLVGLKTAYSQ